MTADARALIAVLADCLAASFTPAGQLALTNPREHRGGCSPRRCWQPCRDRRRLLDDAVAYLERTRPPVEAGGRQMEMGL